VFAALFRTQMATAAFATRVPPPSAQLSIGTNGPVSRFRSAAIWRISFSPGQDPLPPHKVIAQNIISRCNQLSWPQMALSDQDARALPASMIQNLTLETERYKQQNGTDTWVV